MTAEVREKLISEHGSPKLRSVYRAACDDCRWISDDWATPSSAAREARTHNGTVHRYWGDVRMKINERKAEKMRKKKDVDDAIEIAEARLAHLLEERARLDKLPAEPGGAHPVVRFGISFDEGGERYAYAAIKAAGAWWLTGKTSHGMTWHDLLEFMSQDFHVSTGERPISFVVHRYEEGTPVRGQK